MAIFRDYLGDWEFDEAWREFITRLADISAGAAPRDRHVLEGCSVWGTGTATQGIGTDRLE